MIFSKAPGIVVGTWFRTTDCWVVPPACVIGASDDGPLPEQPASSAIEAATPIAYPTGLGIRIVRSPQEDDRQRSPNDLEHTSGGVRVSANSRSRNQPKKANFTRSGR